MARSKTHKDEEDLRGRIRELEKINRVLKKRLRQLEKNRHLWEENNLNSDEEEIEEIPKLDVLSCPSCNHGTLLQIDLGLKYLWTCSSCQFRKTSLK